MVQIERNFIASYLVIAAGVLLVIAFMELGTFSKEYIVAVSVLHLFAYAYLKFFCQPTISEATKVSDFYNRYSGFGISSVTQNRVMNEHNMGFIKPMPTNSFDQRSSHGMLNTSQKQKKHPKHLRQFEYLGFGQHKNQSQSKSNSSRVYPVKPIINSMKLNFLQQKGRGFVKEDVQEDYLFKDLENRMIDSLKSTNTNKPRFDRWVQKVRLFMLREVSAIYHEELNRLSKINKHLLSNYQKSLLQYCKLVESSEHEHIPFDDLKIQMATLQRNRISTGEIGIRAPVSHKEMQELVSLTTQENHIDHLMKDLQCEGDRTCSRLYFFQRLSSFASQQRKAYSFHISEEYPADNQILLTLFKGILKEKLDNSLHPQFCYEFELKNQEIKEKACYFASEKFGRYKHFKFYNMLHKNGLNGYPGQKNAFSMIVYYLMWLNGCCAPQLQSRSNKRFLDILNSILREYNY